MGDDLNGVAEALALARRTVGVIRQNVALSFATKLLALALAALGFVNLWIAVAADMGTSLVVTLNGMRLALPRRISPRPITADRAGHVTASGHSTAD
jgi:Cd2+/Zn2+-exporting ATPase